MSSFKLIYFLVISIIMFQSCGNKEASKEEEKDQKILAEKLGVSSGAYNNTKGYWPNGQIITEFDCPDSKIFPPIDIKYWNKIPVVNGRLPTYEETMNGTSISHYGEVENPDVKPTKMILPKLAYHLNPSTKAEEIVVVIQIVQTAKDTIVGYRYLTGGCGGSLIRDYRFLTDEEVKNVTGYLPF